MRTAVGKIRVEIETGICLFFPFRSLPARGLNMVQTNKQTNLFLFFPELWLSPDSMHGFCTSVNPCEQGAATTGNN